MSAGRPPFSSSAAKSTALTISSGQASTSSKALAAPVGSTALVEYTPPVLQPEDEDLEVKLRRIIENVPVRVSNTSGSLAGSGSGDFHQLRFDSEDYTRFFYRTSRLWIEKYRQMRRKEQDRLARMDADYQRRKEKAEFIKSREERLKAAEEQTATSTGKKSPHRKTTLIMMRLQSIKTSIACPSH